MTTEDVWIKIGFIFALAVCCAGMLVVTMFLRSGGAHAGKMARKQANEDAMRDQKPRTEPEPTTRQKKRYEWFKWITSYFPILALAVATTFLAYYWLTADSPSINAVWTAVRRNGLWIILGLSVLWLTPIFLPAEEDEKSEKRRKERASEARNIAYGLAAAMFIVLPIVNFFWGETSAAAKSEAQLPSAKLPLASEPQSKWPKLAIPAGGESERIPLPVGGMHVSVAGWNIKVHNVFSNGTECISGAAGCGDGDIVSVYVTSDSREPMVVAYAYEPKK